MPLSLSWSAYTGHASDANFPKTVVLCDRLYNFPGLARIVMFDDSHLDRQAFSECTFERMGNAFGSTGAERERTTAGPACMLIDRRRARLVVKARLSFGFDPIGIRKNAANLFTVPTCIWIDRRRANAHFSI